MSALYDTIGVDYARLRRPDPRIAAMIDDALGDAKSVLNVGAGAGNYEPAGRAVTALEPSREMIAQRPAGSAPVVEGTAENLPFDDDSFDAAMAVLTVHHWTDSERGLAEMRRVARQRVAILTFDATASGSWHEHYWPELAKLDEAQMPPLSLYERVLGPLEVRRVPIPHDCTDGFLFAYWRRPSAYLDPRIRKAISSFWKIAGVEEGLARLEADIASGEWERRNADLLECDSFDFGYRLIVASHG